MPFRLLVVDDEEAIRVLLQCFLVSLGYEADVAPDGVDALTMLENVRYDLVLSDINMPRMKGFELLKRVRSKYPAVKRALITAYDVDEYLNLALEHDVGNIIPKTMPFNFDDVKMVVHNLLTEDIFGIRRHISDSTPVVRKYLRSPDAINAAARSFADSISQEHVKNRLGLVLSELLTNAIFYGARQESGENKEEWKTDFLLSEEQAIEACWASDDTIVAFSVTDNAGRLTKRNVLHWICRQIVKDSQGLPVGVFDTHGRGLFIARKYVDSLIINIKPGFRTEVVGIVYLKQNVVRHKPLYINEL